jgi:hypothetical protein
LGRELRQQGIEAEFFVLDWRLGHLLAGRPRGSGRPPGGRGRPGATFRTMDF